MSDPVRLEMQGAAAVIVIDNPPVNALSKAVRIGLLECLARAAADASAKGIVIAGGGGAFIAGADLKEMQRPPEPPLLPDVIAALDAVGKPTAAALAGHVLGGGLEAALACRLRVAHVGASLGFPEVRLGLAPGAGGTQRLMRHVDFATAARMAATGRPVAAAQALALGLVDEVTQGDVIQAAIQLLARQSAKGAIPAATGERAAAPPLPGDMPMLAAEIGKFARGQPAPPRILAMMAQTSALPFAEGLRQERALFLALRESSESISLRRMFLAERQAGRLPALAHLTPRPLHIVGIVGAGLMGCGIAYAAAAGGCRVRLAEMSEAALAAGRARMAELIAAAVKAGRLTAAKQAAMEAAFSWHCGLEELADCDLAIEAVFEDMAVKHHVFSGLDAVVRPGCILATNTSYLDLDAIAAATRDPSRVLGLHFFSPAHVMRGVEVVRGARTLPDVLASGIAAARKFGKIPVAAGVCEGFCGNRILRAWRLVAEAMLEDGASPRQVDDAMTEFGLAMGPFAAQDMAGLEIAAANRRRSPPLLKDGRRVDLVERLVAAGRTGSKAGAGWHRYGEGSRHGVPDPDAMALIEAAAAEKGILRRAYGPAEIVGRLLAAMRDEAQAVVAEGIVGDMEDVALILVHGYGFPPHRTDVFFA